MNLLKRIRQAIWPTPDPSLTPDQKKVARTLRRLVNSYDGRVDEQTRREFDEFEHDIERDLWQRRKP